MTAYRPLDHNQDDERKDPSKACTACEACTAIFAGSIFLMCLLLVIFNDLLSHGDPSPKFILQDVKLDTFNFSTLTSNLQITIFCKNTRDVNGLNLDEIDVYASYRNQQITLPTRIPPTFLDYQDVTVWSLHLNGTSVPLSPDLAAWLAQDVTAGAVLIDVKATGRLRFKNNCFTIRHRMKVNCPGYVTFGTKTDGTKPPFVEGCYTYVLENVWY